MGPSKNVFRLFISYIIVHFIFKNKDDYAFIKYYLKYISNDKYILIIILMILMEIFIY